ncbi:MAG: LD-carboxypeptidase [Defluviitaleaceae bacterium]|nr:LD-carboxypeptidase [Defluviitaleaceae bacterium]
MKMPKLLHRGDLVAITAASGPCAPAKLEAGVRLLESLGLKVRLMPSCHAGRDYLAGTDARRLEDLHENFASKEVRGIFMARGGYGSARLLPYLDYSLISRNPKIFVGYSDVTALHIALNQICKLITFHGPMPAADFGTGEPDPITLSSLRDNLFAGGQGVCQGDLSSASLLKTIVPGNASGILTGGNLSLLAASLGTPYEIKTRGRVLFMEETQEPPYRVDRLFLQLKQAGKFREAAGIVLGDFSPETPESLKIAIEELIIPENKPTISGLSCGHTTPNMTLPLGGWARISTESSHQLEIRARPGTSSGHRRPSQP